MFRIINKDVFKGLIEVKEESVDLIFIDPPYNLKKSYADAISDSWISDKDYMNWVEKWLEITISKLKANGS
ncbi:DNA methyltransferase, partial [Enterococcus faecalis]|uniref:DNA methyltransferase n=1 Tax=Enterococcus faecalis TaxID=1351 RepID=UPI003D6BF9D9